jgi:hypothetical protein
MLFVTHPYAPTFYHHLITKSHAMILDKHVFTCVCVCVCVNPELPLYAAEAMKSLGIPKGVRRVLFRTLNTDRHGYISGQNSSRIMKLHIKLSLEKTFYILY